jgi:hypothetical protein
MWCSQCIAESQLDLGNRTVRHIDALPLGTFR